MCVKLDGKMPTADTGAKKRQQPTHTEERSQAARGKLGITAARAGGRGTWQEALSGIAPITFDLVERGVTSQRRKLWKS